jgi:hypothetical protein
VALEAALQRVRDERRRMGCRQPRLEGCDSGLREAEDVEEDVAGDRCDPCERWQRRRLRR